MQVPTPAEGETGREEKSPAPKVIYRYIPPVSKPWVSMGSEKEIEEETVSNERIQVIIMFMLRNYYVIVT